jgi:hypothetical protein
MLEKQTLSYYDWDDIQQFLSEKMNIDISNFRNYHKVVDGNYKDFWHVWMDIVYQDVNNDSYKTYWFDMMLDQKPSMIEHYGEWVSILFDALNDLQKEVNEEKIVIRYSW